MGQAPDVGSRRHPAAKFHQPAIQPADCELLHLHFDRLKLDLLLLAGKLVAGTPLIFLAEKGGGVCLIVPQKADAAARTSSSVTFTSRGAPIASASQS